MDLLLKLRRLFSNKPNVIQIHNGTLKLPVKSLHPHWIVGRGLCMYCHEDFTGVPRSKRRAALELKLPVWSPFERTGYHCVWSGNAAMVWFWDEDKVVTDGKALDTRRFESGADRAARVRILPETVFFPRKPAGVHLQACREGFELQHWRADVLVDAFWFSERPDARQLSWFVGRQESEGHALPYANVPEAPGTEIAPEPWSSSLTPGEWFEVNERALIASCLLALLLAVIWQEARFWKTRHLKETVASEFARMEDELGPLLEARNELLRLRRTNRALADILREPSQARLMGLVDRALPSAAGQFREWRYQQRELRVIIEDPDPDPIAYVRALEAVPLFEQVRAEPAPGDNRIEITLRVRA